MSIFGGKNKFRGINAGLGAPWAGNHDTSKVLKYGSPADPQAWNRMMMENDRNKELDLAQQGYDEYSQGAKGLTDVAGTMRDRYDTLYRPMEDGLAQQVQAGYNPDYAAIQDTAKNDVGQAFDNSVGTFTRNAARMGLTPSDVSNPQIERARGLDKTASQVYAANAATDNARQRADQLNATRGQQLVALGRSDPMLAATESAAGAQGMGDIYSYEANMQGSKNADTRAGNMAGANMVGDIFSSIGSFADGGSITKPPRDLAGPAGNTVALREKYDEAYGRGDTDKDWPGWLADNGYELGRDLQARPKGAASKGKGSSGSRGTPGPATPAFLFEPYKNTKKPDMPPGPDNSQPEIQLNHYACGGLVRRGYKSGGAVELESDDYIMPADVVRHYGRKYFDGMVAEAGG